MGESGVGEGLRLAELLAALSLATDLAHQVPAESALKDALLSVALILETATPLPLLSGFDSEPASPSKACPAGDSLPLSL